jgi:LysR family glycine cleavage system transcriptional activator
MSRLPLNTLPAFVAAAQLQSLRAAADALHLTHSAVSQQIAALEERLGFPLFDRRGRRIVLNAAGEALLGSVAPALQRVQEGVQAATVAARGAGQTLRLTIIPSFAERWFLPRLARWRERHPDILLDIDPSSELVDLVRDGFHAGLRTGTGPWPGLVVQRLYDGPTNFIAVADPGRARRLAAGPREAMAREPLLGDRDIWARWFAAAGIRAQPVPVAAFGEPGLMLQAVEQGLGVAVVRELFAADALQDGRLVKLFDVSFVHERVSPHSLVYPEGLKDWPPVLALRDWLRDEFECSRRELASARVPASFLGPAPAQGDGPR